MTRALRHPLWVTVRNKNAGPSSVMGLVVVATSGGSTLNLTWDNPDPFGDQRVEYTGVAAAGGGYATAIVDLRNLYRAELWWYGLDGSDVLLLDSDGLIQVQLKPTGGDAGVIFVERGLWLFQYRTGNPVRPA